MIAEPHVDVRFLQPLEHRLTIRHQESYESGFSARGCDRFEAESRHLFSKPLEQRLAMSLDSFYAQTSDIRQRFAERRQRPECVAAYFEVRARIRSQLPGKG